MVYLALFVSALLVVIDQITKWLAVEFVKEAHTINLININGTEILNFTYHENTGAAFSILQGKQLFLIIVTGVFLVLIAAAILSKRVTNKFSMWSLSVVLAGGVGNLIDRILHGYVVDFIDFRVIRFAVFNFADMCAVIGAILFVISILIEGRKKEPVINNDTSSVEE